MMEMFTVQPHRACRKMKRMRKGLGIEWVGRRETNIAGKEDPLGGKEQEHPYNLSLIKPGMLQSMGSQRVGQD